MGSVWRDITGQTAANDAANIQAGAARSANEVQRYIFDQQREDAQPWRQAGQVALSDLMGEMGLRGGNGELNQKFSANDLQFDPGYQFRMQEGQKAIERSAAARGGLNSGATMKALTRYSQGVASDEYQNAYNRFNNDRNTRFNRLASLSGVGQTANNQLAQAGQNYANATSQNLMGAANAQASARMAAHQGTMGLLSNGIMAGMAFSDERLKKNIKKISKKDIQELRETIKPYFYDYTSKDYGGKNWIGVMAQDLEKSKLGRSIVKTTVNGFKVIDMKKLSFLLLASLAEG